MGLLVTPADAKQYMAQRLGSLSVLQVNARNGRIFGIFGKSVAGPTAAEAKNCKARPPTVPARTPKTHRRRPNGSAYADGHGLVTIRMKPDSQGRFGFNVKKASGRLSNA